MLLLSINASYARKLAILGMLASALLLGSCHLSDDHAESQEPKCVIQSLEYIAANSPAEIIQIDVKFVSPQRFLDVASLLKPYDLLPIELRWMRGSKYFVMTNDFESTKLVFEAARRNSCSSETNPDDRLNQTGDENDCELLISSLKLSGQANTALAFKDKASLVATTSRVPSNDEMREFIEAKLRHSGDPDTEVLDCTSVGAGNG